LIQGFVDAQKIKTFTDENSFFNFLDQKLQLTYSKASKKGRPSYRRSLQPSKENIQHFKT
jgi:hypothetical protein